MDRFDVAVIGLGGIGSAILAECARRGLKVIGVDQYREGHDRGASSGKTRLFRKAYFESERYIPLLERAEKLWRELEVESGQEILRTTGLLMAAAKTSTILRRAGAAAATQSITVETLSAEDVRAHFPAVTIRNDEMAIFEAGAGVLDPERAIAAQLRVADARGAMRRHELTITRWQTDGDAVVLHASDGTVVQAKKLVLALGPWFAQEMETIGVRLRIQRNVQVWFSPASASFHFRKFPAFLIERPELPAPLYGFPDFGDGVKAAFHGFGERTSADSLTREISAEKDVAPLKAAMDNWMPGATDRFLAGKACMYSLTPDENFVVDFHPRNPNVILCGGFSGHGYKFAPVIGEIAADLALKGETPHDISFLSVKRFRRP